MTFEGLGEMFEGDSADTCAGKFPLVSMGERAEGLACADPGARTRIGASGNSTYLLQINHFLLGASIKKQIFSLYISDMRYYITNYDLLKMILIINLIRKFHTGLSSFTLFHSKYYNIPLYGCISPQPLIGGVRTQNKLI